MNRLTVEKLLKSATACFWALLFVACSSDKKNQESASEIHYTAYTLNKDHTSSFVLLDSLDTRNQTRQAANPTKNFNREYIQKDGSFYQHDFKSGFFFKYHLSSSGQFVVVDSVELGKVHLENFLWKAKSDSLLLFTVQQPNIGKSSMHLIETDPLRILRQEDLPLPSAIDEYGLINIGVVDLRDDKLWIAYSFSKFIGNNDYTTAPQMYYTTLDFHSFECLHSQEDHRSTYPGGISTVQNYQDRNEQGDLYFMTCPGIALGNREDAPTAIFRKLANSNEVDRKFMINISAQLNNHAYGFWYLGDQKAIIRSEQKDKYTDFSDHHSTYQFEYYLVDLDSGDLEKINIPLDKGTRKETVLIEQGIAYIAIDDKDDQHSLWAFDPSSKQTKLIRQFGKDIDFILRLDKLK